MSTSPPGARRAAVRYLASSISSPASVKRCAATSAGSSPSSSDTAAPSSGSGARRPPDPETPDEIHLLRFDSGTGLEAARRDPEMQALAGLRATVVRKAVLVPVADVPLGPYFADPA